MAIMADAPLTAQQAAFVREYLTDLNATNAAIRAGYSARSASQTSSRLMANDKIASAVAAGKQRLADRSELSRDGLVRDLAAEFQLCLGGKSSQAAARIGELLARMHGWIDDKPQQAQQLVNLVIQR
jgi:phage terminase small subunit